MEWTSALATGHDTIDAQHRELFQCLADLERAAAEDSTMFAAYTLTRLKHYVRDHFTAEEALLKACGYPRYEEHVAEHARFRQRLAEFQVHSVRTDITGEMVAFLYDWLSQHIARVDLDYVPYLKQK